ncbi:MAG: hypothetical protein ACK5LM_06850 [Lactovum sp.]
MMTLSSFIIVVPVLMFILSSLSLLINVKYQSDQRKIDSLRSQRQNIRDYATDLITASRNYVNTQVQYLEDRLKIQKDIEKGHSIDASRSVFVYGLKDEVIKKASLLQVIIETHAIAISNVEFPVVQAKIIESTERIQYMTHKAGHIKISNLGYEDIEELKKLTNEEIRNLILLFSKTQDFLTMQIRDTSFYNDMVRKFTKESKKILIDPLFSDFIDDKNKKDSDDVSYK